MDSESINKDKNEEQAAVFSAFSDPTRLKLILLLAHQEEPGAMCVNALAQSLGVSQSAVSQHLRILKNIGLVNGERKGYRIHYTINRDTMQHFHDLILEVLAIDKDQYHRHTQSQ